jgi:hypothetical protein
MRDIGTPGGGRIPVEEFQSHLEYEFLAHGWAVVNETDVPIVEEGEFRGFHVLLRLEKQEEENTAKAKK